MKKNHLFISKSNSNKMKIRRAKTLFGLSMFLLVAFFSMIIASIPAHGIAALGSAMAILPLVAGVKGTMKDNGIDESDAEFATRAGKAEAAEAFQGRLVKYLENKINALEDVAREISEVKEYQKEIKTLKETVEAMKKGENLMTELTEEIKKTNLIVKGMQEKGPGTKGGNSLKTQLNKFIEDNATKISEIYQAKAGFIEMKVVGNVTTASGDQSGTVPDVVGTQLAPPQNINLRDAIIDTLITTIPTSLAAFPYTEVVPKDGDFDFVAEGAAKPQIDFEWDTLYATPKKVAAWIRMTEEVIKDVASIQSIGWDLLRKKHAIKRMRAILFGDGIGENPTGATTYGRTFTADDLANQVEKPNIMDVINACITDIFTTHNFDDETPYMANTVMMNPVDFFINFVSAKDTQGHPLYPSATIFNKVVIGGVTIIPDEMVPAGKIFVADMSKYNTTQYVPYTVKIGWINDDFIKNQFVMLAESRFHAFVKNLDQQAFIYDDIATVKAAIEMP